MQAIKEKSREAEERNLGRWESEAKEKVLSKLPHTANAYAHMHTYTIH